MDNIDQSTPAEQMNHESAMHLSLLIKPELLTIFSKLAERGFRVSVQTGCSIKELICNQLGIAEDYLENRIQTIFLNAKAVDDLDSTMVTDGSTLALSGAMPGLVGVTMRRGGFYAALRSQISHDRNKLPSQSKNGQITLKLWNLVVKELGPTFLQQGIWITGKEVRSFIERHREELKTGCVSAELEDQPAEVDSLFKTDWKANLVFLQVKSEQAT